MECMHWRPILTELEGIVIWIRVRHRGGAGVVCQGALKFHIFSGIAIGRVRSRVHGAGPRGSQIRSVPLGDNLQVSGVRRRKKNAKDGRRKERITWILTNRGPTVRGKGT
jgi:hypothetical protein